MKTFLFSTLMIISASTFAQCNLVVNPDFSAGATANSLILLPNASNWYNGCPTTCNGYPCTKIGNTPDLMDANSSNQNANGLTSMQNGPHYPYVGNRWAYIAAIETFYGKLSDTLQCGMLYKLRLRLSTSDIISNTKFTVSLKNGTGSGVNCSPSKHIETFNGSYSTSGWDLVTDTFSLSSAESA